MKANAEKFKELWAIPQYRALIKLGLYILFFLFIVTYIRVNYDYENKTNNQKPTTEEIEYSELFNALITYNNKTYEHIKTQNTETLKIDDITYNVNYNILDNNGQNPPEEYTVKFWRFTPEVINTLIKKGEILRKTTDYALECDIIDYSVSMREIFENINSGLSLKPDVNIDNEKMNFQVQTKDKTIKKVVIDVTNYKNMFIDNQIHDEIIIEYK